MDKAKRIKKIWLAVVIVTAVTAVAGLPALIVFAINDMMALMAVALVLFLHGFFGITFYALALSGASHDVRVVDAIDGQGLTNINDIAMCSALPIGSTADSIRRCMKRGYIVGYIFDGNDLIPIEKKEYFCEYCGKTVAADTEICSSCGAHIRERIVKK